MATVNFIKNATQSATAMSRTLRYVKRNDKTRDKQFVSGWNCTPRLAEEEFLATRQAHRKSDGRWFYHYTQSFSPKENVTPEGLKELAALQREILENAARYVKPGGRLLFSTCTVDPLENEENREWFLEGHPEFTAADLSERLRTIAGTPAGAHLQEGFCLLLPGQFPSDGFFFTLLKKKGGRA